MCAVTLVTIPWEHFVARALPVWSSPQVEDPVEVILLFLS